MRAIYSRAGTVVQAFRPVFEAFRPVVTALGVLVISTAAQAQPFANLKGSAVDYSVGKAQPRMTCEALGGAFKDKDLVSLKTRDVSAIDNAPAHCRVSGVLSPEIGFE